MSVSIPSSTPRPSRLRAFGFVALGLVAGVGGTILLTRKAPAPAPQAAAPKAMYQCPMHPQILQDHPGSCPICGMDLVLVEPGGAKPPEGEEVHGDHAAITIDPTRQQLIGLKTAKVVEGNLQGEIRTVGRLAVDETRVRKVTVKVEGFVEKLFADFVGKPIAKDQPLFSLYSPEFVSAQKEYLLALRTRKSLESGAFKDSGEGLAEAARRRLQLWDVPAETLEKLEQGGQVQKSLILRSPVSGVITAKSVVEGGRISPSEVALEITDLSRLWGYAEVYEPEIGRIKVGMPAALTLDSFPGKTFSGQVTFIDPFLDPKTRTAKVRVEFANTGGLLKPEMYGEITLRSAGRRGILVPRDAVLEAGSNHVAFVSVGDGRFEPRELKVGANFGEDIEILSGLKPGEEVVTRANFLVDSESRLRAALAQMAEKPAASGHKH